MAVIKLADVEMGLLGALGICLSIFLINLSGGFRRALLAAAYQLIYSFVVISFNTSLSRIYAKRSILIAILLPTVITTVLTYLVHYFGRSPEPFWSASFAFATALPSFMLMTYRFRKSDLTLLQITRTWLKRSSSS